MANTFPVYAQNPIRDTTDQSALGETVDEPGKYKAITEPEKEGAASDWKSFKNFMALTGRLTLDVSEIIAPIWLMTDYKLGIAPNSIGGIVLVAAPAFPGLQGGSFIYGNEPEWLARVSQLLFIGSNFLFSSVTRPGEPQDPAVNSSKERIARQKELILAPSEKTLGATRQFTSSQIPLRTAGEPESLFESVFAFSADHIGLFSTAHEQTHGPKGETLEGSLQDQYESNQVCTGISLAECRQQTRDGKPVTAGGVQAFNATITGPINRTTGHMLESARINYRLDLMTRMRKQFGNTGLVIGGLSIGINYFLSIKPIGNHKQDPITKFDRNTERGKRIKAEGAQILLDIAGSVLANGETDHLESCSLTLQRFHDVLKQYIPAQLGSLGTQWVNGESGNELGLDPAKSGYILATGFFTGKQMMKGYIDYKRDHDHPGDIRNKIDWAINIGLDILDLFSTYGYVNDPENHVEGKQKFNFLGVDMNAKQAVMSTTTLAIGARYVSYFALGPLMADSPVKAAVAPTPDGLGVGLALDLAGLLP